MRGNSEIRDLPFPLAPSEQLIFLTDPEVQEKLSRWVEGVEGNDPSLPPKTHEALVDWLKGKNGDGMIIKRLPLPNGVKAPEVKEIDGEEGSGMEEMTRFYEELGYGAEIRKILGKGNDPLN